MKCDVCKKAEATVYLTQIIKGETQQVNLCKECANTKGASDPAGFSMADMLLGLGGQSLESPILSATGTSQELKCEGCGMTQSDFKKSGRLGCSRCYETFADNLAPLLKGMHKGEQHIGKIPPGFSANLAIAEKMKLLRRELAEAVRAENFEAAAEIRDRLRTLELESPSKPPSP